MRTIAPSRRAARHTAHLAGHTAPVSETSPADPAAATALHQVPTAWPAAGVSPPLQVGRSAYGVPVAQLNSKYAKDTVALTDKILAYASFEDPTDPERFQVGAAPAVVVGKRRWRWWWRGRGGLTQARRTSLGPTDRWLLFDPPRVLFAQGGSLAAHGLVHPPCHFKFSAVSFCRLLPLPR